MVNPDLNEASRVARVNDQAAADAWRGVKPVGVFANALVQDNKDYPDHLGEQNTKTTTTSTNAETAR